MFPDRFTIRVQEKGSGAAVPGVVLWLTLFSNQKSYTVVTPVSGPDGLIVVQKDFVQKEIIREGDLCNIAEDSFLKRCKPQAELTLPDGENIRMSLQAMQGWAPLRGELQETIGRLSAARNAQYHIARMRVDLSTLIGSEPVVFEVEPV